MSTSVESEAQTVGKPDGPQTPAAVTASAAVSAPLTHVWEVLVSPAGSQALLGDGAVLGAKGEPYHCEDGTYGVVRSYHPLEQLRVSWHSAADSPATIVEVDLRADGDTTVLDLSQTHLHDGLDLVALEERWTQALTSVAGAAQA
ncbi:hypothetical protein [Kineosporia sp. A_224]|uniref:hypothetical protein n=1 Tax=Kineosporia sp. A_224 TaxID=1962180 RepID=UPI0018EA0B2E|nr:hypothetical protein [Kineosporia sp. A_224]